MSVAANTIPPLTGSGISEGRPTARPNPVALEALVTVTGARPSSEGTRDLFTEETKTILVFVDGAVIQLAGAVAVGQLLFLTNKKNNEEVVCQILHKRVFRPTVCYVEVQFTEEKPNFWGVAFSKAQNGGADFAIAEQVAAEETTEDDNGTPVAACSEQDVDQLKLHVEVLRKQLRELERKAAEEAAAKQPEGTKPPANMKEQLAPVNDPVPEALMVAGGAGNKPSQDGPAKEEALLMRAANPPEKKAPRWAVPMALPNLRKDNKNEAQPERDPSEDLLPKPELDFSKMPSAVYADESDPRSIYRPKSLGRAKIRSVVLAVVLAAALAAGAYQKVWKSFPVLKNAVVALKHSAKRSATVSNSARAEAAVPRAGTASSAEDAKSTIASGKGAAGNPLSTKTKEPAGRDVGAEVNSPGMNAVAKSGEASAPPGADSLDTAGSSSATKSAKKTLSAHERVPAKKGKEKMTAAEVEKPPELVAPDTPVIAAKLVRGASPVYPPDAMLNYITGDVKAELVVEADGRVGEVRVISGPKALRDAAVEALKKYEYAPATQGGRAVASKTTAMVKFWFNP